MNQDWSAVSDAIKVRLDERGMTMTDLASKSGVSLTTVRELVHVLNTRRRQPRTLVALSVALGWPADHLGTVLRGGRTGDDPRHDDPVDVRGELRDLRRRVEALERAVDMKS
ncbi:hypothetical protein Ae406Ps2_3571 [Pseudonocardia sp. Ae406_Ps2]|uniref:helix-turn-helix domain-containing protein n=1 Tax=unclassified Pseudonocardia TaxID=2619320 RepID=UPI00094B4131|nr:MULTISPECIES: helix-turn-helix transcriptional regulator [unclassified Pseudonocardia]OLL98693.1 hypothetical protein Ae331Ps2_2360c [Pseudonocardia sp. Ae331_Ps2]OLM03571.1 hypothetical protein Ae406Ps2_3571 [Pseudonocardia sp. Ae406_Ps2]OLM11548.1 hypothetical protein Ae505Ps2_1673c [Pseudonocardia sp. Ae505_Ps2]OLM34649.1 hypothetical protein Ae717Ps2_5545c [Pseudonocardia sp. Ae717_Ps2]